MRCEGPFLSTLEGVVFLPSTRGLTGGKRGKESGCAILPDDSRALVQSGLGYKYDIDLSLSAQPHMRRLYFSGH